MSSAFRGRECLVLDGSRSFRSGDVLDVLRDLFMIRGVPKHIRSDNGPDFIAKAIRRFLTMAGVETLYIEPGAPWQNGYAESFHSRVRDEFMAGELFADLEEARVLADRWKNDYNHRPRGSAALIAGVRDPGNIRRVAASASGRGFAPPSG